MKKIALFALILLFSLTILGSAEESRLQAPFPTSPLTGVESYRIQDNSSSFSPEAMIYLWKTLWEGEEVIFAHFVLIDDVFKVDGDTLTVKQNNKTFSTGLFDEGGIFNDWIYSSKTFRLEIFDNPLDPLNVFDSNQVFELCDQGENCFVVSLSSIFTLHYDYSVSAGTTVTFNVRPDNDQQRCYQFWIRSGYNTSSPGNWQIIQNFSTLNTCNYTFNTLGHYVVVCWIKEDLTDPEYEIIGFSIKVE